MSSLAHERTSTDDLIWHQGEPSSAQTDPVRTGSYLAFRESRVQPAPKSRSRGSRSGTQAPLRYTRRYYQSCRVAHRTPTAFVAIMQPLDGDSNARNDDRDNRDGRREWFPKYRSGTRKRG